MEENNEKIKTGLIHGSFDMLETRDVDAINLAKEECKTLVVGVYSDEMYERLKGKKPEIPFKDRKILAEYVKGVDYVIEIDDQDDLYKEENKNKLREALKKEIEEKKKREEEKNIKKKYKVGYIQGTFDMFHRGHLNLFINALKECETIIVGVNSDEFVQRRKHKVPVVPCDKRMIVADAIKGVKEVHSMDTMDKLEIAELYDFDVICLGDDLKGKEGYDENLETKLKEKGIDIIYFPYTKEVSSTALRKQLGLDANGNKIQSGEEK